MNLEFPYQLTTFLDDEPTIGEPVYYGENGWYPQVALKRRFKAVGITENELLLKMTEYFNSKRSFEIRTGELTQPERMPVKILEIAPNPELINFHNDLISFLGNAILSRYPERDGANYLPHVTAEFDGKMVINDKKYINQTFDIKRIYLLKDISDENSVAYKSFDL
ncbi:MAG: hypothetical protein JWN28_600 [Candidatus Saccharibacteria bacterium]|nr:hypothetical protein [Candidatus Saccharibacteria bacterium]